jgi:hypothetical protein
MLRIITRCLTACWVAGMVAVGTVRAQTEAPATTSPSTDYTLVPDSSDNIRTAIDQTVRHMNFIVRGIARGRLTKINPTPHEIHFAKRADTVSVAFDNGNPVVTPLSGDTVKWVNPLTHETDQAHASVAGDTTKQTIVAPDGERENALLFTGDSARLVVRVTVRSHRLPRPLVYTLMFRREGDSGTAAAGN